LRQLDGIHNEVCPPRGGRAYPGSSRLQFNHVF
jgi:hypothetical protein